MPKSELRWEIISHLQKLETMLIGYRCTEAGLTNVLTRSPEMAPRLVYRNKKYGRYVQIA